MKKLFYIKSGLFEHGGYYKEYYVNGKYIGSKKFDTENLLLSRVGYMGREKSILTELILLENGKQIKAGTQVTTLVYPLCGKFVKTEVNNK